MIKKIKKLKTNKEKPKRKKIFIPEVKINTAQENITSKVWPISGWIIKNKEIIETIKIDIKYLKYRLEILLLQRMVANIIIKNGFSISIGWNLGKKNKSIHLFDPLTSAPIIGTKNNEINETKKRIIEYLNNWSVLIEEKTKIINTPIQI